MEARIEGIKLVCAIKLQKLHLFDENLGGFSLLFLPAPAHTPGLSPCLVIPPPAGPGSGALRGDTDVEFVNLNKELYIGITPTGSFTGKISQLEPRI